MKPNRRTKPARPAGAIAAPLSIFSCLLDELATTHALIARSTFDRGDALARRAAQLEAALSACPPGSPAEALALLAIADRALRSRLRAADSETSPRHNRALAATGPLAAYLTGAASTAPAQGAAVRSASPDLLVRIAARIGDRWRDFEAEERSLPRVEPWCSITKRFRPLPRAVPSYRLAALHEHQWIAAAAVLQEIDSLHAAAAAIVPSTPEGAAVAGVLWREAIRAAGFPPAGTVDLVALSGNVSAWLMTEAATNAADLGLGAYASARSADHTNQPRSAPDRAINAAGLRQVAA